MRIRAHAAMSGWRECGELLTEFAVFVEQFMRPVTLHPVFELLQMLRVLEIGDRDLVCPPSALDRLAINEFRPSPSFRGAKDDHWPARAFEPFGLTGQPRGVLNQADPRE